MEPVVFDETDLRFPLAGEVIDQAPSDLYRSLQNDDCAPILLTDSHLFGRPRFGRKVLTVLIASTAAITTAALAGSTVLLARESLRCKDHLLCGLKASVGVADSASPLGDDVHPLMWSNQTWDDAFEKFTNDYEKAYDSEEEREVRKETFKGNLKKIWDHNLGVKILDDEDAKIMLAPNQFTDLHYHEFRSRYLQTSRMEPPVEMNTHIYNGDLLGLVNAVDNIPESVDWRKRGCVTPVKDQAHCGSCWAFSATGAMEGAICAQTGKLLSLSEQQLVDCGAPEGAHGCNGGFMDNAFQYVIDNEGICGEKDYPYEGVQGECAAKDCAPVTKITGLLDLPVYNERAILTALALYGPVAVGVEADRPAFQFYHSGVFALKCGKQLNHAMLVVGYGTSEEDGIPYWLVKNSWGTKWGDSGFIKVSRKKHHIRGECGILLAPTIPLVEGRKVPEQVVDHLDKAERERVVADAILS